MDDHGIDSPLERVLTAGTTDDNLNISDVIEVIATDPDFKQSSNMYNGGSEIIQTMTPMPTMKPKVKIIEQPASKALRFRYECEGRSAGSIPGVSSTPENKTFPAIQIIGYQGRAVVVVSCVTKDLPHRPHPHNLVGREGCKKGVCTLEVSPETMSVTFSNLGIQCVKKKDIEAALKVREEIRVDPFRTGFAHRNQPTSIDLNAVRLCFQVFLEGEQRGKFTVPLTPVISEPIYDKKAMCDLVIVKLSDCVSCVDGGRKDIILLCEKVAKEDIQIRFYEEKDGQIVWEGFGDFQPSQVHKQTAIWFRPPRYKTLDISDPVKVFIQLRRPSDGATSEPYHFELLPLDSGRPAYWSFRRNLAKKGNYNLFSSILANDARLVAKRSLNNSIPITATKTDNLQSKIGITTISEQPEPSMQNTTVEWCDYSEVDKCQKEFEHKNEEKSLNDLLNQVAELDEIYSESRMQTVDDIVADKPVHEFDESRTYTSLQLAFKNTLEIDISDRDKYEDIVIVNPQNPVIDASTLKRENEIDKLPPLPPKRQKKVITDICDPFIPTLNNENKLQSIIRCSSLTLPRSRSHNDVAPSKRLPPSPSSTLPNPKKRGFFSKLFTRKKGKTTASLDNIKPGSTLLLNDFVSEKATSETNVSVQSNASEQEVVQKTDLNANDDLNMNLDLSEAEHYALYMAMAPHATQSEFDEMSCYYSPVESGRIISDASSLPHLKNSKT